jgi:prepilin-type N-terminal cleavage/methylation domain-containing protein
MTLIEVITVLAIAGVVASTLYLLLGAGVKGYLIAHARVADEQHARLALTWMADRLRQASNDPHAPCPEAFMLTGDGNGYARRLAFRATADLDPGPRRQTYAYYVENRTLWQETRAEDSDADCGREVAGIRPAPDRTALTAPLVRVFSLAYLDRDGSPAAEPGAVRSVRLTLAVEAPSFAGRVETQTYETLVTVRGP